MLRRSPCTADVVPQVRRRLPAEITSDTEYTSESIACGKTASGFTAAINQLSFGSAPGAGAGDACGRCFAVTGNADPFSPAYTGPFKSIVVKVTDLWCVGIFFAKNTSNHVPLAQSQETR